MEHFFRKVEAFFVQSPEYIYLVIGIICLVLFIGILKNKDWAIDPNSDNQRFFYNNFGRTAFRFVVGMAFLMGTISGFGMFLFFYFIKK